MHLKGDQSTSRAMNRRLILDLLRAEGPKSRADIADKTHIEIFGANVSNGVASSPDVKIRLVYLSTPTQ